MLMISLIFRRQASTIITRVANSIASIPMKKIMGAAPTVHPNVAAKAKAEATPNTPPPNITTAVRPPSFPVLIVHPRSPLPRPLVMVVGVALVESARRAPIVSLGWAYVVLWLFNIRYTPGSRRQGMASTTYPRRWAAGEEARPVAAMVTPEVSAVGEVP